MTNESVCSMEDLHVLFKEKYLFTILVKFHEATRSGYISRVAKRKVSAPTMKEACNEALSQYSDKQNVRIGGITLPENLKLGSKRPPNPFMSKTKKPFRNSK